MSAILANFLIHGMEVSSGQRLLFMLPLCLSIAIVYKTTHCEKLRDVPKAALILWITIVIGMYAVGFGLWGLYTIMA